MIKKIIILCTLVGLIAFFSEKYISLQDLHLSAKTEWQSSKKLNTVPVGLVGVNEFSTERQALAGEQLNLGAWFGYQDVFHSSPPQDFAAMKFKFTLEAEKSHLWMYLNCDNEKCLALRISSDPDFPGGIYLVRNDGEFIRRVATGTVVSDGAYLVRIEGAAGNPRRQLFLDGRLINEIAYTMPMIPIRFRGGYHPASVQNIEVTDRQNQVTHFDFKAEFSRLRFFLIVLLLSLISAATYFFKRKPNAVLLLNLTLLLMVVLLFGFDRFYWSKLYRSNAQAQLALGPVSEIKNNDFQLIHSDGQVAAKASIEREIAEFGDSRKYLKVAIIGGSQAWGGGATAASKTWGALLVKEMARLSGKEVVGINFSIWGGVLFDFIERAKLIAQFKPDLLIVNLGFNDSITSDLHFDNQMGEFLKPLLAAKINVLFSIEANSFEYSAEEPEKAEIIRNHLFALNLPTVSLHRHLASTEFRDSGMLWHDQVHFTDYGHKVAAQFFVNSAPVKKITTLAP